MFTPSELLYTEDDLAKRISQLGDALTSLASDRDAIDELAESVLKGDGAGAVEVLRQTIPQQLETMGDLCYLLLAVVMPHVIQRGWRTATDWYQVIPPTTPGGTPTTIYVATTYSDVPEDDEREQYYRSLQAQGLMTSRSYVVQKLVLVPDRTLPC